MGFKAILPTSQLLPNERCIHDSVELLMPYFDSPPMFIFFFLLCFLYSLAAANDKPPIWRSADMAKAVCDQAAKFNETGTIPEPVKDKPTKEYCGFFKKADDGDLCAGSNVHFWACKSQISTLGVASRIVGGKDARPYKYPSIVLLKLKGKAICAGAIYNAEWVVTAGHCIVSKTASDFSAVAADHNKNEAEGPEQEVKGTKLVVHEKFDDKILHNDIALIKISPQFQFNEKASAISLPPADFQPSGNGIAVGWGRTSEGGPAATILQEVEVPMITTEKCQASYPDANVTDDMLCATFEDGGKDACQGDSGGPFYACIDKRLVHVGVVSWGEGCARKGKPGVYTKTAHYLDWLKQNAQG